MHNSTYIPSLTERNEDVLPVDGKPPLKFDQFGLHCLLLKALDKLGFQFPSPVQLLALPEGLNGKDLLVQAKSGTGKTVTFGLIILQNFLDGLYQSTSTQISNGATRILTSSTYEDDTLQKGINYDQETQSRDRFNHGEVATQMDSEINIEGSEPHTRCYPPSLGLRDLNSNRRDPQKELVGITQLSIEPRTEDFHPLTDNTNPNIKGILKEHTDSCVLNREEVSEPSAMNMDTEALSLEGFNLSKEDLGISIECDSNLNKLDSNSGIEILNTKHNGVSTTMRHKLHSLVISPTRELAIQIADEIQRLGWYIQPSFRCICLIGGVPAKEDRQKIKRHPNLIVGTPGRILGAVRRFKWIKSQYKNTQVLVLDEADLLLSHSFREIIEFLLEFFISDKTQILALSATFPPPYINYLEEFIATLHTKSDHKLTVHNPEDHKTMPQFSDIFERAHQLQSYNFNDLIDNSTTLPESKIVNEDEKELKKERKFIKILLTASHKVTKAIQTKIDVVDAQPIKSLSPILKGLMFCCVVTPSQPNELRERMIKLEYLSNILKYLDFQQAILFSNNPIEGMQLAQFFTKMGIHSEYTSSYLSQSDRVESFTSLKTGRCKLLICSDVMSRGVDATQVDLVINWDIPMDKETFIHRFGRAGRFGLRGYNISVCTEENFPYFNYLFESYQISFFNYDNFLRIIKGNNTLSSRSNLSQFEKFSDKMIENFFGARNKQEKAEPIIIPILGVLCDTHCCSTTGPSGPFLYLASKAISEEVNHNYYYLEVFMDTQRPTELSREVENAKIAYPGLNSNFGQKTRNDGIAQYNISLEGKNSNYDLISPLFLHTNDQQLFPTSPEIEYSNLNKPYNESLGFSSVEVSGTINNDQHGISLIPHQSSIKIHATLNSHDLANRQLVKIFPIGAHDIIYPIWMDSCINNVTFLTLNLADDGDFKLPLFTPYSKELYKLNASSVTLCLEGDINKLPLPNLICGTPFNTDHQRSPLWEIFIDKLREDLAYFATESHIASSFSLTTNYISKNSISQLDSIRKLHQCHWAERLHDS